MTMMVQAYHVLLMALLAIASAQVTVHLIMYDNAVCTDTQNVNFNHIYTLGECARLPPNGWYTVVNLTSSTTASVTWACADAGCARCGYYDSVIMGTCSLSHSGNYFLVTYVASSSSSASSPSPYNIFSTFFPPPTTTTSPSSSSLPSSMTTTTPLSPSNNTTTPASVDDAAYRTCQGMGGLFILTWMLSAAPPAFTL